MSVTCHSCSYENPTGTEFCEVCGSELSSPPVEVSVAPTQILPETSPSYSDQAIETMPQTYPSTESSQPQIDTPNIAVGSARLVAKQVGSSVSEFSLDGSNTIIGRFDPDSGPVDIDLEGFSGDETISRHHAEIYCEQGQWKVQDLGSTNGVFIKHSGQTRFGARVVIPEILTSGDEVAFGKIRFLFHSP
jgi:pSer/pThr/pTyr-binding forkhead associated (FHA) protein